MKTCEKLQLLLWKDLVYCRRNFITTFLEFAFAFTPFIFLVIFRAVSWNNVKDKSTAKNLHLPYQERDFVDLMTRYPNQNLSLYYFPENDLTKDIMDRVQNHYKDMDLGFYLTTHPLKNGTDPLILSQQSLTSKNKSFLGVISFESEIEKSTTWKSQFVFAIRIQLQDGEYRTGQMFPQYFHRGLTEDISDVYIRSNFVQIQHIISMKFIEILTKNDVLTKISVQIQKFPHPTPVSDIIFPLVMDELLPRAFFISFLFMAIVLVKRIDDEKECGVKAYMKWHGLSGFLQWFGWFNIMVLKMVIALCCFGFLCLFLRICHPTAIIYHSNPFLILLLFLMFIVHVTIVCLFISTLSCTGTSGAGVCIIFWVTTYIALYELIKPVYDDVHVSVKVLSCFLPSIAMSWAIRNIAIWESTGQGVQFDNLDKIAWKNDISFSCIISVMLLSSLIFCFITWYFNEIYPGPYQQSKPFYFLIIPPKKYKEPEPKHKKRGIFSRLFPKRQRGGMDVETPGAGDADKQSKSSKTAVKKSWSEILKPYFQTDPRDLEEIIVFKKITKAYGWRKFSAPIVNRISLIVYKEQITVMLGGGRSGKSAVCQMLAGATIPSEGSITVAQMHLKKKLNKAKYIIGFYPQRFMMFPDLTPVENFRFFGKLRGLRKDIIKAEGKRFFDDFDLTPCRNELTKDLNNSKQRKVGVAFALIGSQVVILDEPTANMDSQSRIQVLNSLFELRKQKNKTIFMTTSNCDVAGLVADRLTIIYKARLRCCGSPDFLNEVFGKNPELRIVVTDSEKDIKPFVERYLKKITVQHPSAKEFVFSIPQGNIDGLWPLLAELDEKKEQLGVEYFVYTPTKVQNSFIKVCDMWKQKMEEEEEEEKAKLEASKNAKKTEEQNKEKPPEDETDTKKSDEKSKKAKGGADAPEKPNPGAGDIIKPESKKGITNLTSNKEDASGKSEVQPETRATGFQLFWYHLLALQLKHFYQYLNNIRLCLVLQIFIPFLVSCIMMEFINRRLLPYHVTISEPSLQLTLDQYGFKKTTLLASDDNTREAEILAMNYLSFPPSGSVALEMYDVHKGALDFANKSFEDYRRNVIVGAKFKESPLLPMTTATAMYNTLSPHSLPISLGIIYNAVLRRYMPVDPYRIVTINKPLVSPKRISYRPDIAAIICLSFLMILAVTLLPSFFVLLPIEERVCSSKRLQMMMGVRSIMFWFCSLLADYVLYLAVVLCVLLAVILSWYQSFINERIPLMMLIILLLFGLCAIPMTYLWSYFFWSPVSAFISLTLFNFVTGIATTLCIQLLKMYHVLEEDEIIFVDMAFHIFPSFLLITSILNAVQTEYNNILCETEVLEPHGTCTYLRFQCCPELCGSYCWPGTSSFSWHPPGVGTRLLAMAIIGLVCFVLILILDLNFCRSCRNCPRVSKTEQRSGKFPEDVAQEQENVKKMREKGGADEGDKEKEKEKEKQDKQENPVKKEENISKIPILVSELNWMNKGKLYLDTISFSVAAKEGLGIIGPLDAGKSLLLRIVVGNLKFKEGIVEIDGLPMKKKRRRIQKNLIGYCPQKNILLSNFTGYQLLYLHGRLLGVRGRYLGQVVESLTKYLEMKDYINKRCYTYSSGEERMLNISLSLLHHPLVLILDEPFKKIVNPIQRRDAMALLKFIEAESTAVLITGHGAEELNSVATRLAVIVDGKFLCIGTKAELLKKASKGFIVTLYLNEDSEIDALKKFMQITFKECSLLLSNKFYMKYHVDDNLITWTGMHNELKKVKKDYKVVNYSFNRPTVEEKLFMLPNKIRENYEDSHY